NSGVRFKNRVFGATPGIALPTWQGGVLIGWCGMRGLGTLATAFAPPCGFPRRDRLLLPAFVLVLRTLGVQGPKPETLLSLLKFNTDASVERDVSRGRAAIMQPALDLLAEDKSDDAAAVRKSYLAALSVAESETPQAATVYEELKLKIIPKQRQVLQDMR